jgi:chromosome segregation ATPase
MLNFTSINHQILLGLFGLVVLLIIVLIARVKRTMAQSLEEETTQRDEVQQQLNKTNKQLLELRSVVVGLNHKMTEQEDIIILLSERITELEQEDTDARLYSRASKLVKLGADINEVITECELPKAEAELMYSLQQKLAGKETVPPLSSYPEKPKKAAPEASPAIRKNPRS